MSNFWVNRVLQLHKTVLFPPQSEPHPSQSKILHVKNYVTNKSIQIETWHKYIKLENTHINSLPWKMFWVSEVVTWKARNENGAAYPLVVHCRLLCAKMKSASSIKERCSLQYHDGGSPPFTNTKDRLKKRGGLDTILNLEVYIFLTTVNNWKYNESHTYLSCFKIVLDC